ncbi:hypothetical protein AVEN_269572-1 [Araneus ventricosus]|uniref:Uncharacterized protein n=1 Tax=Araneus ventricosus TaxID=182803 RepID=A0A4Y2CCL0_ARAVE|nr:hypothetical protein AVEN_269572-1 [Araneus ventricosus]
MDLVILSRGQKTRMAPGTPSPNFRTTPTGEHLAPDGFNVHWIPLHGGSSMESGFESGTLRPQIRSLTTRPPRPHFNCESNF